MTSRLKANPLVHTFVALALIFAGPTIAGEGGGATIEELIENCKGKTSLADLLPMVLRQRLPLAKRGIPDRHRYSSAADAL